MFFIFAQIIAPTLTSLSAGTSQSGSGANPIFSLIAGGVVLIVTHIILQMFRDRWERGVQERKMLDELLHPLMDATDDLVSRLTQFVVNEQTIKKIPEIGADQFLDQERLKQLHPDDVRWRDVTMYRLVVFLHSMKRLTDGLHKIYYHPDRDRLRFILSRKFRTMAGGSLYGCQLLGRELQQLAGETFDGKVTDGRQPTIRELLICIGKVETGTLEMYLRCGRVLNFDPPLPLLRNASQTESKAIMSRSAFAHTCALAHITIYLIDFLQAFQRTSKYTVERIVLVSALRAWNSNLPAPHGHLYEQYDINGDHYLQSFPLFTLQGCGVVYRSYWWLRYFFRHPLDTRKRSRRLCKKVLWWRAKKDARRHNLEVATDRGVVVRPSVTSDERAGKELAQINYTDSASEAFLKANTYWETVRRRVTAKP